MVPIHPDKPAAETVDAVILAGGRGQRMGGLDKGLLSLAGQALATHVAVALRGQVASITVNANRNAERYAAAVAAPVIADPWPDFRGPLAGICAGFAAGRRDWLLAVPADMPGLPDDLVAQLAAGLASGRAAYARIAGDPVYPLCLLHRSLAADLRATVERGEYAVGNWLKRQAARAVNIEGWADLPLNLNTPERLLEAEKAATTWNRKAQT